MSIRLVALIIVLALFGLLSGVALLEAGYWGLIEPLLQTWAGLQVLADLTIMCVLGIFWMIADARRRGFTAWPFVILTLATGSFGPLTYLVMREIRAGAESQEAGIARPAGARIS